MTSSNFTFSLLLTFTLLFSFSSSISDDTIKNAAEILSNSGFNSISLTLPLIVPTTISTFPSSTLFTPSDASFSLSSLPSGQPSFSLLQFHLCPRFYSFADLQSLSYGSLLPTILFNYSLTITASVFDDDVSINGVKINSSPIFDDGFFIVFEIDRFFNPNFTVGPSSELSPTPTPSSPECAASPPGYGSFHEASTILRSRGYSLMAAFLDLQLSQFYNSEDDDNGGDGGKVITLFAPTDASMEGYSRNYSEWGSIFLRHVVGCELSWGDLVGLNDGFILTTFSKDFQINVTRNFSSSSSSSSSDDAYSLMLNGGVSVDFPEFYRNDKIVIHGLSGVLVVPENSVDDDNGDKQGAYSPANHVEF